jgi:hypothetical protein
MSIEKISYRWLMPPDLRRPGQQQQEHHAKHDEGQQYSRERVRFRGRTGWIVAGVTFESPSPPMQS